MEKTKRALGILQSRASADLGNGGDASTWLRRPGPLLLDNSEELKRVGTYPHPKHFNITYIYIIVNQNNNRFIFIEN